MARSVAASSGAPGPLRFERLAAAFLPAGLGAAEDGFLEGVLADGLPASGPDREVRVDFLEGGGVRVFAAFLEVLEETDRLPGSLFVAGALSGDVSVFLALPAFLATAFFASFFAVTFFLETGFDEVSAFLLVFFLRAATGAPLVHPVPGPLTRVFVEDFGRSVNELRT